MQIVILNRFDKRIAELDYGLLIDPVEIEDLEGDKRFNFHYPATAPDSDKLIKGNKITITDIMGNWQLYHIIVDNFVIGQEGLLIKVESVGAENELLYREFVHVQQTTVQAGLAMDAALSGTGWSTGTVEITTERTINTVKPVSPYEALVRIAREWEGELLFRVEVSGSGISEKKVDLLERRGAFRGKAFELAYDLEEIAILNDIEQVNTAKFGWGQGQEIDEETDEAERLDFADVEWVEGEPAELYPDGPTAEAPVDKPLGQKWVGCPDAKAEYGLYNPDTAEYEHRFGEYESQAKSPEALIWETWRQVEREKYPLVNVRATVRALQQLEGFDHERVDLGDTNYVKLEDLISPLETRVIKITRKRKSPADTVIELGNFRPAETGELAKLQRSVQRADSRAGVWDQPAELPEEIPTSKLEGIIEAVDNQIRAGGGTVLMDGDGFWIMDSDQSPGDATAAVRGVAHEGEAALVLGKRDTEIDEWEWRVGMTSEGFKLFGEELIAGTIKTDLVKIEGDTKFYWDSNNLFIIDPEDASKQIRIGQYDGVNYGIAFTQDGGSTWLSAMTHEGLIIGAHQTFEEDYDPSDKETPEGAQAKADTAKDEAISESEDFTIEYAEKKVTRADTAPGDPEAGDLWLDTSKDPNVWNRWDGSSWKKATPENADEIEETLNKKWAAETGADITGNHTANDTENVNGTPAADMATLMDAQSKADAAESAAKQYTDDELDLLGDMAYEDLVEEAKLGTTIIEGGYIVTGLIDASRIDTGILSAARIGADSITAEKIDVDNLSAISGEFTTLMAGHASNAARVEFWLSWDAGASQWLPRQDFYDDGNNQRLRIDERTVRFFTDNGADAGHLRGGVYGLMGETIMCEGSIGIRDYCWIGEEAYIHGQRLIMPQPVGDVCRWATIVSSGRSMAFVYSDDDYNSGAGVRWYGSADASLAARAYHSSAGAHTLRLHNTNLHVYGSISEGSSRETKENVKEIGRERRQEIAGKIKQLQIKEYEQISDKKKHIGVIAEEVEQLFPELVIKEMDPEDEDEYNVGKDIKLKESVGLFLTDYVSVLAVGLQELIERVEKLENNKGGNSNE